MFGIISYFALATVFLAPMPASLKKEACQLLDSERIGFVDQTVLQINMDNNMEYSSFEFIQKDGKVIESWPMFGSTDYFQWDLSHIEDENVWIVFRNNTNQACQVTQVK